MKMALKVELCHGRAIKRLRKGLDELSLQDQTKFRQEWETMVQAGAEIAEVKSMPDGRIVGYPSEDFIKHMEAWGMYL